MGSQAAADRRAGWQVEKKEAAGKVTKSAAKAGAKK